MGSKLRSDARGNDTRPSASPDISAAIRASKRGPDRNSAAFNDDSRLVVNAGKITTLITDLDRTLWEGVLAEKQKVRVNDEYYDFLRSLHRKGITVFAVSKNDEEEVNAAFDRLAIDKGLFTAVIANWDPKYLTIERLVQCTGLRPETVVLVDDNPLERTEVKARTPQIYCIDSSNWDVLRGVPYIMRRRNQASSEIRSRANRYKTAIYASDSRLRAADDAEFYRGLKREISIGQIGVDDIGRYTRLLVETHRINFNPGKFAEYGAALEYLHERLNAGDRLFAISTKERGMSLGLTGALVVHHENGRARITDGTFSCGIIGRDFEQRSILALIEILKREAVATLEVCVTPTGTNKRMKDILVSLGFSEERQEDGKIIYSMDITHYAPKETYGWIALSTEAPELDYEGHPAVIGFFDAHVKPLIRERSNLVNIGSSRGEVLGFLQDDVREEFDRFLAARKANYLKIDKIAYPGEDNIVADAEDLKGIVPNRSQDLVMAVELLEHTEHFWLVINEMNRIAKQDGLIFLTVPSFNYPKHEYPIDLWRIGPETISKFFPPAYFETLRLETEGMEKSPRRTMILVRKLKDGSPEQGMPEGGRTNWKTGLTLFP